MGDLGRPSGKLRDCSGSCTGVSTRLLEADSLRRVFFIQNLDEALPLFVNLGTDKQASASIGSFKVNPGSVFTLDQAFCCTDEIHVFGGPGVCFTAKVG
jgi:hypothetical protein